MIKKHSLLPLAAIGIILVFAAAVRWGTFFMGHGGGDQTYYTALAMKLDVAGLQGYTLRDVGLRPDPQGLFVELVQETNAPIPLIAPIQESGISFYDVPLFYTPPLFAEILKLSHTAFGGNEAYRLRQRGPLKGSEFHRDEFYAALPSFCFSLGTIILVTVMAWRHFGGSWVGVMAAALLAASPVDVLAASRVWPDAMAVFFLTLSWLLYLEAGSRKMSRFSFGGGVALGLAILSKGTTLFFVPSLILACGIAAWSRGGHKEAWRTLAGKPLLVYLGTAFVLTLPWHALMVATYGNPFYSAPFPPSGIASMEGRWFSFVRARPWFLYPLNTFFQNPAFLLWILPLKDLLKYKPIPEPKLQALLFPIMLTGALLLTWPGKEERYILVAYPALAALAAYSLNQLRKKLDCRRNHLGTALTIAITAGSVAWSLGLVYFYVYIWQSDMVPVPF